VRDVQRRLTAAGFDGGPDEAGRFGPTTEKAVRAFQDSRGLNADGIVGPQTWNALVEAGYRLGDRLLYLRTPMLRGDDVDELQRRLGALGFDAGRVDGILGPQTARALQDFQRNAGLTTDGICGPESVAELRRLGAKAPGGSVADLRERESLRRAPRTLQGRRLVVGQTGGLDVLALALERSLHERGAVVVTLHHPDGSVQAAEANETGADAYLGVALDDSAGWSAAYYASAGFESSGGKRLAGLVHEELAVVLDQPPGPPRGMRLPVLRETRMPAVLCRLGSAETVVPRVAALAEGLARAVARWAEEPLDT
jgi:N-acetylmuramoyl-L-alanine amidase